MVVDGADRLRDGADVEIPNPDQQDRRAFRRGAGDAARAAPRAPRRRRRSTKACSADIKKLCAGARPGTRAARSAAWSRIATVSARLLQGHVADAPAAAAAAAAAVAAAAAAAVREHAV